MVEGKIKDIWIIEEQATRYLISKNRFMITPKTKQLNTDKEKKKGENLLRESFRKKGENLYIPRVPIFNIKLAKIIEPEPLALTWALVSQKWRK